MSRNWDIRKERKKKTTEEMQNNFFSSSSSDKRVVMQKWTNRINDGEKRERKKNFVRLTLKRSVIVILDHLQGRRGREGEGQETSSRIILCQLIKVESWLINQTIFLSTFEGLNSTIEVKKTIWFHQLFAWQIKNKKISCSFYQSISE